jgi:hypothetical protein
MKKTFVTIGITVFVVGIALFGTAYLALAQGENIINVCVAKDGSMRVVAGEEQCKSKETPLSWNKQGEPGEQGEPGPAGVLGFYTVTSERVEPPGTIAELHQLNARCDVGDSVTGGGFRFLGFSEIRNDWSVTDDIVPTSSQPIDGSVGFGEGWGVMAKFGAVPFDLKLEVFAVCADLTP